TVTHSSVACRSGSPQWASGGGHEPGGSRSFCGSAVGLSGVELSDISSFYDGGFLASHVQFLPESVWSHFLFLRNVPASFQVSLFVQFPETYFSQPIPPNERSSIQVRE